MFVKIMENRIVRRVIYAVLGALCLYHAACCVVTLCRAGGQPYLLAGTERFDFLGYHMMAALHGVICAALVVVLILLIRGRRKREGRDGREIWAGRVDKGKSL